MFINTQISPRKKLQRQNFGLDKPDFAVSLTPEIQQNTNLNNIPSIQNKVIVSPYKPAYKEIQTFEVPNVGLGKMYQLKNGHKVIIISKPGTTNIYTHVKVGFFDEPKNLKGVSHLLEHLMAPYPVILPEVKSNASTTSDITTYYATFVNKNKLEDNIRSQSKILKGPNFTDEKFLNEKKIVTAELSEHTKFLLHDAAVKANYDNLFGKDKASLSFPDEVLCAASLTKQDLIEHYNKFYTPDNMVTTIVGEVDPDETIKMVSKYFNVPSRTKGKWENDSYPDYSNITQKSQRADFINTKDDKETKVNICFVGPDCTLKNRVISVVLANIISKNSPVKTLGENFLFTPEVVANTQKGRDNPPVIFDFGFTYEDKKQNELKSIYNAIFDAVQDPIKDTDVEQAKKLLCRNFEDNESSSYLCDFIGENVLKGDSPDIIRECIGAVNSLTTKEVDDFKKKYIDLSKASVILMHPKNTQQNVAFGRQADSNIEQYELPNNLTVVVDTTPGTSRTRIGLEILPAEKTELSKSSCVVYEKLLYNKTDNMLKSTNNIAIFPSVEFDGAISLSISSPPEDIISGIKTAKNLLFSSQYSEEEFQKAKDKRKALYQMLDTPITAQDKLDELFGNESFNEVKESIDKITLVDTRDVYNQIMSNAQGRVVITMPKKDFQKYKNGILTELSQGFPKLQKQQILQPKMQKDIDKPYIILENSTTSDNQAIVRQAFKIFHSENIKDQMAVNILINIANTRILQDLREEQGLSYTPSAYNDKDKLIFSVETNTSKSPENIKKIMNSLSLQTQNLMQTPVSQEELDAIKNNVNIKNKIVSELSFFRNETLLVSLNTPYGALYPEKETAAINEITPEHIQKAAQLIFGTPSVTVVVAPVTVLDPNREHFRLNGKIIEVPIKN